MDNGEASIKKPRDSWGLACDFFGTMLDDFRSKDLLRRNIDKSARERLNLVWENSRKYQTALDNLFDRFKAAGKDEDFDKKCAAVGFPKDTVTYLVLSQLIGTFLINLEALFRTSLLFFLKEERGIHRRMPLGDLLGKIKEISPAIGEELDKVIDTELRNCLAHGSFWFDGGVLFRATNSYLEEIEEISLGRLMYENMKMNIITEALVHTLKQKERRGYFDS